ncbi:MAG: site-2 protease family protein [Bacilli bacterium]|nr:site-2 protease family protein [Bacilli bacterium]
MIIFFVVIMFHEFGHILIAKLFKIKVKKIRLTMIGGIIELDDYQFKKTYQKILINSAGIMINLLLIMIFKVIKLSNDVNNIIVQYNYLMIVVNLLPINPLDGYKIIYDMFNIFFDEEYSLDCMYYLSMISIVICSILLFIFKLYGYYIIICFLSYKTFKDYRLSKYMILKHYQTINNL